MKGDIKRVFEGSELLLEYGEKNSNSRCKVFGHWVNSWGFFLVGDMKSSLRSGEEASKVALDPLYSQAPKISVGYSYLIDGQFQEAENALNSLLNFCEKREIGQFVLLSYLYLAPVLIAKGDMRQGLNMLEETQQLSIRNQRRVLYGLCEYVFGKSYSQIATGPTPAFSIMAKNIGFLVKNVPFAGKKAGELFNKAIEILREVRAKGFLGMAYLDLGLFYKTRKRTDQARQCISEAIKIFTECEAKVYLKQAKNALESL